MSIIDKIKGDDLLDTTITVKINGKEKEELIKFAAEHKLSLGKMVRFGLEMVKKEIRDERSGN